jgi:hypothetical protein
VIWGFRDCFFWVVAFLSGCKARLWVVGLDCWGLYWVLCVSFGFFWVLLGALIILPV